VKSWILGKVNQGYIVCMEIHKSPYRSPLLQDEMFEEPNPGLGVHSADLL
jgi:hypothetical protein